MDKLCSKCNRLHDYTPEELTVDFSGYGYIAKIGKCPYCGQLNIFYYEDKNLDVNKDRRYYL